MYDSVNPYDIPAGAEMVAGYVDGLYAWGAAGFTYHSAAKQVGIAVFPSTYYAHVLDVENGDATPSQAAHWVAWQRSGGRLPALYFSLSLYPQVLAAIAAQGLGGGDWTAWVADWDGVAELNVDGYAKQYANPTLTGRHYDLSIVADYWPGVDALSAPPPARGRAAVINAWEHVRGLFNSDLPANTASKAGIQSEIQRLG